MGFICVFSSYCLFLCILPLELARVQPQAPEIEKAVLGALMIDRDAYMEICNLLRVESFYEPRNHMI